jgi:hypothetical protein
MTIHIVAATNDEPGGTIHVENSPDRFLFGTDEVAPQDQQKYLKVYYAYGPLWELLDKQASEKVRNARQKVRAWERAHTQ